MIIPGVACEEQALAMFRVFNIVKRHVRYGLELSIIWDLKFTFASGLSIFFFNILSHLQSPLNFLSLFVSFFSRHFWATKFLELGAFDR